MPQSFRVVLDSSSLITVSKFRVRGSLILDYLLDSVEASIPPTVWVETVEQGARRGYTDAEESRMRVENGSLSVVTLLPMQPAFEQLLDHDGLENGDKEVLWLYRQGGNYDHLVTDDYLLAIVANRFGMQPLFLPDLLDRLTQAGLLALELTIDMLNAIRPRDQTGFIEHSLAKIQGVV